MYPSTISLALRAIEFNFATVLGLRYSLLFFILLDNYCLVTVSTNFFKIFSILRPSASALKLGNTRCLKIGITRAFTSSILGVGLPSSAAFAFAPSIRY